ALVACGGSSSDSERARTTTTTVASNASDADGTLMLDTAKDYGDKYADGILPVGDGRYTTDAPKQGYLYVCRAFGQQAGGAMSRGPWFVNDNTEYDINKKVAVEGTVQWDASYSMSIDGDTRVITTNDLPRDHTTGVFPVQPSDPAYQYD